VRARIVQAFAIVALLHALTPLVDPTSIALDELSQHYGETVQLDGRVTAIDAHGDVLRFELTEGNRQATVLTRAPSFTVAATGEIGASTLNLAPSTPDQATGPTLSQVGSRETYDFFASGDPDGSPIKIEIDWGDGTALETDYIDNSGDGTTVAASHYWWTDGIFDVRSRSVDIDGAVSEWSDPLHVEVLCSTSCTVEKMDDSWRVK
jgi:hypothetical protein